MAAERRKLQNRLNQRAARTHHFPSSACAQHMTNEYSVGKRKALSSTSLKEAKARLRQETETQYQRLADNAWAYRFPLEMIKRPVNGLPILCMSPEARRSVTAAPSFESFVQIPLPADQKLLTLLHFNLVRALACNVALLGLAGEDLEGDVPSPFLCQEQKIRLGLLPPSLRPTQIQMTMPHHAEVDVFPYPEYRDNVILAGDAIDDVELCNDILYGVDPGNEQESLGFSKNSRTGFIVWSDPWLQESWEIDEHFLKKYWNLFQGCGALIENTNYWRKSRGEKPLSFQL